jgi:hypothetical protein
MGTIWEGRIYEQGGMVIWIIVTIMIVIYGVGVIVFYRACKYAPYYDSHTGRFYRYISNNDNPHHASCPICRKNSKIIIDSYAQHVGVFCKHCGIIWFDITWSQYD